ncbi:hypothetical protein [uncultured Gammaproteobacteria bacterium]|nr:hypothetical protein [uncultured Gammaproteobacteria bacterium]
MNKDKLKEFVGALDALSDDVKDWDVNIYNERKPTYDNPGCHTGLISIVAEELPELQDIYKHHLYFTHGFGNKGEYHSGIWADALAVFLGFIDSRGLEYWANDNPDFWGNELGIGMFCRWSAFTDDLSKGITHRDIIEHWKQVLANIEA